MKVASNSLSAVRGMSDSWMADETDFRLRLLGTGIFVILANFFVSCCYSSKKLDWRAFMIHLREVYVWCVLNEIEQKMDKEARWVFEIESASA